MHSTTPNKKIPKKDTQMISVFLVILLSIMANIAKSDEIIATNWQVVEGPPTVWNFQNGKIQCEVANVGMHRILSKKIIEGDWVIEAEIECSNNRSCPSQSIHFSVAEDYSYGYILTLKRSELLLTRIVTGEGEASWAKNIVSNAISAELLGFGTGDYEIVVDNFAIESSKKQSITDNFESDLSKWNCYIGQATTHGGKLLLGNDNVAAHNEGIRTVDHIPPTEYLEAIIEVDTASGGGGYQIDFRLATDDSGYIGIQRRFGDFGSKFLFKVVPGWDLPSINVPNQNRQFKLKITCDRSTGVSAGYYDLLDGKGWVKIGDTVQIEAARRNVKVWPIPVNMSMRKLKIFKRGGTYAFSLDDHIVGTITNPKLRGAIQINDLYKFPEPNKGRYGLAFIDSGEYKISKFQIRSLQSVRKYKGNPILPSHAPQGAWDQNQAFPATIRKFEDTYYLYYTGVDNADPKLEGGGIGRIGVATSNDGYYFEKYEKNPVFDRVVPDSDSSLKLQGMASVKLPDGKYALTYTVWNGKRWGALEYAVGSSPLGPFHLGLNNPMIVTSNGPDFDESHVHLHNIVREDDGSYVMLYTGFGRMLGYWGDRGGFATSKDFTMWTKYAGNPVFPLGENGAWDDNHVRPKGFIKYGNYYYMFYEGAHYAEHVELWFDQVGMARSKDLIHWERYPYNPIIPIDAGGGRDTLVTEWPTPIETGSGLAVFYWGGMPGNVGISRAEISKELLEAWK